MTFEYQAGETVVRRDFAADVLESDTFSIIVSDELLTVVSYDQARRFWLGKISLDELVNGDKKYIFLV